MNKDRLKTMMESPSVLDLPDEKRKFQDALDESSTLKDLISKVIKESAGEMSEVNKQKEVVSNLRKQIEEFSEKSQREMEDLTSAERAKYQNVDLSSFNNKISELTNKLEFMEKQYSENKQNYNLDWAKDELSQLNDEVEELRHYVSGIQETIIERLGQNTVNSINARIDAKGSPELDSEQIENIQYMAQELMETMTLQIQKTPINIYHAVDVVVDGTYTTLSKFLEEKIASFIYLGAILALLLFIYNSMYGIFALAIPFALMAITFYNTYTSNKALIADYVPLRQLSQLADLKEGQLNTKAKELLEDTLTEMEAEYLAVKEKLVTDIEQTKKDMNDERSLSMSQFNELEFKNNLVKGYNSRIDQMNEMLMAEQEKVNEMNSVYNEVIALCTRAAERLKLVSSVVMSKASTLGDVGNSYKLNSHFFMGLDNEHNPNDFQWGKQTSLIIYKETDLHLVKTVIEIMQSQMIMFTDPTKLYPFLVDMDTGGVEYTTFAPRTEWSLPQIFSFIRNTEDSNKMLDKLKGVYQNALEKILVEAEDIHTYNDVRHEMKSLTSPYHLIYFVNYRPEIFNDNTLKQIVRNSYKVGIIPVIFISDNVINAINTGNERMYSNGHLNLIESIGDECVFRLTENGLRQSVQLLPDQTKVFEGQRLKEIVKSIQEGER